MVKHHPCPTGIYSALNRCYNNTWESMGWKSSMSGKGKGGWFGCEKRLRGDAVVQHVEEEIELLKWRGNTSVSKMRPKWFMAPLWLEIKKQCCRMSDQSSSQLSHPGCGVFSPSLCSPCSVQSTARAAAWEPWFGFQTPAFVKQGLHVLQEHRVRTIKQILRLIPPKIKID